MKRRKAEPAALAQVSVTAIVDELVRSHSYAGDGEARRLHCDRIRSAAAGLGVEVASDWLPSFTPAQAEQVLAAIVNAVDPLVAAQAREAASDEDWRRSGQLSHGEMLKFFPGQLLATHAMPQGEAWGPADTELGPLRQAIEDANRVKAQRIANSIYAAPTWPAD